MGRFRVLFNRRGVTENGKLVTFLFLNVAFLLLSNPLLSQEFIADYSVAREERVRYIPLEYINKARQELVIAYQHTSHGTHVARGVFGLQDYKMGDTTLFGVSATPAADSLEFRDNALESYAPPGVTAIDLSVDETAFIQTTRNYLDAPENASVNVIMWSWCNIYLHDVAANYLPGMDSLINEYGEGGTMIGTGEGQRELPVTFIRMTGHANENANVGVLQPKPQADTIVSYSIENQQYCLDYYSIDTYDMDDNYWEDAGDDGNSVAYGGNFYHDWQNSHTLGEHWFENKVTPGGAVDYGEHNTQHITANRKGYAMWWILARIAGWDGSYFVNEIQLSSTGDSTQVMSGDTLRFSAAIMPDFANNQALSWSVIDGDGSATISAEGLLRGGSPGTVRVIATALDGSAVADTMDLLISGPLVPLSSIIVTTAGGDTLIDVGSSLQCSAAVLPDTASNPEVIWSVNNLSGSGQVSQDGLLTALSDGDVEVIARAQDGSLVADTVLISIEVVEVPVSDIEIASAGGAGSVVESGTLQFAAAVLPVDATNPNLTWSVINGTGSASISQDGLLTGLLQGSVDVVALATDGSGLGDTMRIVVVELEVPVTAITITTAGGLIQLDEGSSLQCTATVLPDTATNPVVLWSLNNLTGTAQLGQDGLLVALSAGTVEVIATAEDESLVADTLQIDIIAAILVTDIEIASSGGATSVVSGETLQFTATVLPVDATNQVLVWSVIDGSGSASITADGLLSGGLPGTIDIVALASDASGSGDTMALTVTDPLIRVTGISIITAGGVTELNEGNTIQCSATISPVDATNHIVAWSVTNGSGSATIDANGLLTASSAGTIDVIARATDGSGVSNSLSLNINTADVLVSEIFIFSSGGISTIDVGSTLQFTVSVLPANTTNPAVEWSVNNGTGTATICECAELIALTQGTVDVVATALDGSGISSTFAVTILGPSGIRDGKDGSSIILYPNPSMGQFYLSVGEVSLDRIQVISTGGSVVLDLLPDPDDRLIEMDLSDQQPGIFFIHVFTEGLSSVHRIVISR